MQGLMTSTAHIGGQDCKIKAFPVSEDVPTAAVLVFFTPVFPFSRSIGRRSLVENKGYDAEGDEGENRYEAENPEN